MTARRQKHQAALACLQHKQEYCAHSLQIKEHHETAADACTQTIADETKEQSRQAKVVIGNKHHHATVICNMQHNAATIENTQQHAATIGNTQQHGTMAQGNQQHAAAIGNTQCNATTLADKRRCLGKATATAMSAERSLTKERCPLEMACSRR